MLLKNWSELPPFMQNKSILEYFNVLNNKKFSLIVKRLFDIFFSLILLILLLPINIIISILIKMDSKGPILFTQRRVTQYGKVFKIFKFRTMVYNAESLGAQVTSDSDSRITNCGKWLRKFRIDEFPQLINVLLGQMSFVGVRPEVEKYVDRYSEEMLATLLLPAGITSPASIAFKNEDKLISQSQNTDDFYVNNILPDKMKINLEYIRNFSFIYDIKIMILTVLAVIKKH